MENKDLQNVIDYVQKDEYRNALKSYTDYLFPEVIMELSNNGKLNALCKSTFLIIMKLARENTHLNNLSYVKKIITKSIETIETKDYEGLHEYIERETLIDMVEHGFDPTEFDFDMRNEE